nr:MAG TPA: hypothetical protein [Caudoviricetes sp.]
MDCHSIVIVCCFIVIELYLCPDVMQVNICKPIRKQGLFFLIRLVVISFKLNVVALSPVQDFIHNRSLAL